MKKAMDIKEFIALFADLFDDTPGEPLSPETVFHDMDKYSSIIGLSIVSMIDEEYGVVLTGNEVRNSVTIQDLFDTVQAKRTSIR